MSPQSIAHYHVTSKLGEGGMGEVYRATDTRLGRDVAIKVIADAFARQPDRMARFEREAHVLASLNHPNIAGIYGVEGCALIMELVEGPTLEERISQGPIPVEEALPIAKQVAEALDYAHEKGIIHRDLKPANVKLTGPGTGNPGQAKVLDFGLAKALANDSFVGNPATSPTLTVHGTTAGVILGTAAYMSPEQARGFVADRRSDIWSFGVLLFEMLTGRRMFAGETVSDTLAAVLRSDPDWSALPPDTPAAIRRLLRRCLERDRKKRLADIADARLEIEEALEGPKQPLAEPRRRTFRWWIAVVCGMAAAGIALTAVYFRETPLVESGPVRFQIPAPDKTHFGTGMAISPDGRRLAFIATGPDGQSMIWIRQLDSLASRALRGTEGAGYLPFWSPDSRYIGFAVGGRLKKVEASGGPPQTLCELPTAIIGGSWNRDGVIIFGPTAGGLFRVSQAGGVPTKLTTSDESQGEIGHLRPWFLPDGRHFLYIMRHREVEGWAIYLATLDGKQRRRLVNSLQGGAYAPPVPGSANGHVLFLREGTLMAQPIDSSSFELAGEAFPIAEQVGSYLALGLFSVSSNGTLAYRTGESVLGSQLVWFDREGKTLGTLGPHGIYDGGMALAPDGKRVAVDSRDSTRNRDVWLLDVARGASTRFTFDRAFERSPTWSRDGTRLAFGSDRSSTGSYIYQKHSSGSGSEQMLSKGGVPEDWSPDGSNLLYTALDAKTQSDLWLLPTAAATGDRKPTVYLQTPFNERQGQFSPDGRWIAYTSDESGQYQIYVQSMPLGAGKFQISTGGGTQPRWRRDGKEIFYLSTDGKLTAVEVKAGLQFEAGDTKPLFDPLMVASGSMASFFRYDVTADGRRFLVNSFATRTGMSASPPITVVLNWQADAKR